MGMGDRIWHWYWDMMFKYARWLWNRLYRNKYGKIRWKKKNIIVQADD